MEAPRQRPITRTLEECAEADKVSFTELIKQQYRENPPNFTISESAANKYGVAYFTFMLFTQYKVGVWTIIPDLYKGEYLWMWQLFLTYILCQVAYNWFQCCRKYVNKAEKLSEYADRFEKDGWKFCHICQYYVPPRSHHCKLCNCCILRHDHHCFFAAGCIGNYTTSYFTILCIWLLTSQLIAFYWITQYMYYKFPGMSSAVPFVTLYNILITGAQTWQDFLVLFTFYCLFPHIFFVSFYLWVEFLAAINNQTFYEGTKGLVRYRHPSKLTNLRNVLGRFMWIRWIIPFYDNPSSNGYEWKLHRYNNPRKPTQYSM